MNEAIETYNKNVESEALRAVCDLLAQEADKHLPKAMAKIYYGAPVWLINDNPIVGYNITKKGKVNLLFWSGQSFKEPGLSPEGSFKAAEIKYETVDQVETAKLQKWLAEAGITMWNYRDIRKTKGKLSLLED